MQSNEEYNYNHTEGNRTVEEASSQLEDTLPQIPQRDERPRIPKKLHDLVREKKTLSIAGRKAPLEERKGQVRMEHIGTDSQKQIYEKIKVKNKTPPKVANYAEMQQRDREKRSRVLQTASQK